MPSCVIIVENLPVPFDRRVWQEAKALREAGWDVSVICPVGHDGQYAERHIVIDGIEVYRHPLPIEARGMLGFVLEYASALFHETRLLLKIAMTRGFDVIQICNPPDILFLNTFPYRFFGKKVVFDHHDLSPELFAAKFARKGMLYRVLRLCEKLTMKSADLVISANETYRQIALSRGGKKPGDVITIYSVPDRSRIRRIPRSLPRSAPSQLILGYVGVIGDQDGVDHLVRMIDTIRKQGRTDCTALVVGDGPALASSKRLAAELGLDREINFTGYLSGDALLAAMSEFDIGIIPDPPNEYNDTISMNKVFEYSALGIPSVAYDLSETRRLLSDAGEYAQAPHPDGLARACLKLIDDKQLRERRAQAASALAAAHFDWNLEKEKYVAGYSRLIATPGAKAAASAD